jgi:hypothetical protein
MASAEQNITREYHSMEAPVAQGFIKQALLISVTETLGMLPVKAIFMHFTSGDVAMLKSGNPKGWAGPASKLTIHSLRTC